MHCEQVSAGGLQCEMDPKIKGSGETSESCSVGCKVQAETTHSKKYLFRSHLYTLLHKVFFNRPKEGCRSPLSPGFCLLLLEHKFPTQLEAGGPERDALSLWSVSQQQQFTVPTASGTRGTLQDFSPSHSISSYPK